VKTLTDALQIAIVRFVYDDVGELCLYPTRDDVYSNERKYAIEFINLLVANAQEPNTIIIRNFKNKLDGDNDVPALLKKRLLAVLNHPEGLLEHYQLEKIDRKNPKSEANATYIQNLWKKTHGAVDGSFGVKRIVFSNKNATKYLYRWIIKIDVTGEHSRAEYIRKNHYQMGKERTLEKGRIITSKLFPKFTTLNDFLKARTYLLSRGSTSIVLTAFSQFFNEDKFIALDPIRTDEKNLYIYGKPAVGLVHGLAIAFIYQSCDIHRLNNIGFSDYDDHIKFEIIDFGGYKINKLQADDKRAQLQLYMSDELTDENYQKILNLLLSNDMDDELKKVMKTMITKEMIMTELKPLFAMGDHTLSIPNNTNFTGSIWNWRKILNSTNENFKGFEIWCIQTLHDMRYFPTECMEFICALHNHPIDTKLKPYIEEIVKAPVAERMAMIDALSIETLYPKPSSGNSCVIS
jgi:hypothetical protein